jgi:hypothetical protein
MSLVSFMSQERSLRSARTVRSSTNVSTVHPVGSLFLLLKLSRINTTAGLTHGTEDERTEASDQIGCGIAGDCCKVNEHNRLPY